MLLIIYPPFFFVFPLQGAACDGETAAESYLQSQADAWLDSPGCLGMSRDVLPSMELAYPTWGKETHLQSYLGKGYVSSLQVISLQ